MANFFSLTTIFEETLCLVNETGTSKRFGELCHIQRIKLFELKVIFMKTPA